MNITKPNLVSILEATHTDVEGLIDLRIVVTNFLGNPQQEEIPYTWDINEEYMAGEPYDLGLSIAAWFGAHPDFPVSEYVPPTPSTNPSDYPLTMRQLRLGLLANGFPVTFIQDTINAIANGLERAQAQIWYEETTVVEWAHPMTQALLAASGISLENAATIWLAAKDLEA